VIRKCSRNSPSDADFAMCLFSVNTYFIRVYLTIKTEIQQGKENTLQKEKDLN
jgi:hypothetical protein